MHRYRTAFLAGVLATLVIASPVLARDVAAPLARDFQVALAKTDAPEHWAHIKSNLAGFGRWTLASVGLAQRAAPAVRADEDGSMGLPDFAGAWSRHGIGVMFLPDGRGYAQFRTYRWCADVQPGELCDDPNDGPITAPGHASVTIDRIERRTAYGTISQSNDEQMMPNGPFTLTEYQYGIGTFRTGDRPVSWMPSVGRGEIMLCGPRSVDMPDWVRDQHPCGA